MYFFWYQSCHARINKAPFSGMQKQSHPTTWWLTETSLHMHNPLWLWLRIAVQDLLWIFLLIRTLLVLLSLHSLHISQTFHSERARLTSWGMFQTLITELLMSSLRRNGRIWCKALCPDYSQIYYYCCQFCACTVVRNFWCRAIFRFTTLLSNVLHCFQFYCGVVWLSRGIRNDAQLSDLLCMCPRTSEFATKFQDKNRSAPVLRVPTGFKGCKQGIAEIETIE